MESLAFADKRDTNSIGKGYNNMDSGIDFDFDIDDNVPFLKVTMEAYFTYNMSFNINPIEFSPLLGVQLDLERKLLYGADLLNVYVLSWPELQLVGRLDLTTEQATTTKIGADYAYYDAKRMYYLIGDSQFLQGGIMAIDVSDPTRPSLRGWITSYESLPSSTS